MIDGVVMAVFGLGFTLLGFRVFGPLSGPHPPLDPRHLKAEKVYRVCGPVALIGGVGLILARLLTNYGN